MEGNITNNHNLKLIDFRFSTITEIWREKFLCHKLGEIIRAFVSFEVEDVIKIYSMYWLLIKTWYYLSSS